MARDREDVQVNAQVMMAEGVRLFMLDRVAEAAAAFESDTSWQKMRGFAARTCYRCARG